ncbi:polysaccharide biosynthesis protein [Halobacteriovorax marinus]|uniref:polysaccharide biosynthesis protein n=1 Tax=Halobacteriovorax marinus TaxID=97084 RepID=UPI000BDF64CB|nr:nucleoside-diphosphate sugar epimerase/dehydratase [Halobacteriovorax marinus]
MTIRDKIIKHRKRVVAMTHDVFWCVLSVILSFILSYGDIFFFSNRKFSFASILIIACSIQFFCLNFSGLYKGMWRFSSTHDLLNLIRGVTAGVALSALGVFLFNRLDGVPRSFFIIDWLILIVSLGGGRLGYRILREYLGVRASNGDLVTRSIIVGAGAAGEQLVRDIRRTPNLGTRVVAFVDDDLEKRNKTLHKVSIVGGVSDLRQVVKEFKATRVYIAIPSATSRQVDRIVKSCRDTGVEFKTLPHTKDILFGKVSVSQLREVEPEDLLGRDQVELDKTSIKEMVSNEVIMVTGAGGSIGSELCRQIASFSPKKLIFFEMGEFNLYQLEQNIKEKFPNLAYELCIGDVRDRESVESAIKRFSPNVIFHAAAYKHVPLMENNPKEAIRTNIYGTKNVAEFAAKYNVDRFVLISTDKAVRPTNVMGATKRVAEMVCQEIQTENRQTKFMLVRFGNVLGSSGSVIPLFKKQIKMGGPITVTHPEVTRFFMSIPEACQLVLQAGAIGKGGEVFLLDMGKSVKIAHLAKQMISLHGLTEDDIKIEFTGLRPGEKLYEELLLAGEDVLPTIHPLLKIAKHQGSHLRINEIMSHLEDNDSDNLNTYKLKLKKLVEDYDCFIDKEREVKAVVKDVESLQ